MADRKVGLKIELPEAVFKMVRKNSREAGVSVEEYVAAWIEIRMPAPKEGDKFWKFVRKAALRVTLWPAWKKGNNIFRDTGGSDEGRKKSESNQ